MKLKDILNGCLFTDGDWIESKDQDPNGEIRLIQLADIGDGFFVDKSSRFINRDTAKRLRCTFLEKNDVLIARMPDPLGRACVFPLEENEKYVTAVDVCIIRPNDNCNNRYLQYCLNSTDIRNSIERQKTGTTRERITRKKLGELDIPIPPLPQQQKIANILDTADALRQNDKALIAKYDELTQALFLDMFGDYLNGKLFPLKDLVKFSQGQQFGVEQQLLEPKEGYARFLRIVDYTQGEDLRFVPNNSKNYFVSKEDIVIVRYGASAGFVGTNKEGVLANNLFKVNYDKHMYNQAFLYFIFQNDRFKKFVNKEAFGAAMPALSFKVMERFEIPVPPIELQNQFAERVAVIEEQKAIAKKSLEKSESLFNSLLQKAFKGDLI